MNCNQLSEVNIGYDSFYEYESFELKNLPSLISIQLDDEVFYRCHSIVLDSMNDWMNDEWDLIRLQSITLGVWGLYGDSDTTESNELIMKSMNDSDDWSMRSSFSIFIQRRWQFRMDRQSDVKEWWLMIEFELDIPSLTEHGIQMGKNTFSNMKKLHSSSMIDWC